MDKVDSLLRVKKLVDYLKSKNVFENKEGHSVSVRKLPALKDLVDTENRHHTEYTLKLDDLHIKYFGANISGHNGDYFDEDKKDLRAIQYSDELIQQLHDYFYKMALDLTIARLEEQKRMEFIMRANAQLEQELAELDTEE